MIKALIFDVDGTLAETETVHLEAFNTAFARSGLDWYWSNARYRELFRVTGGKERIRHYANQIGLGEHELSDEHVATLHALKNELYGQRVRKGECMFRPGVEQLLQMARARGLLLAICTTTSRSNLDALIKALLGVEGIGMFSTIICGEDVSHKKPSPDAYLKAIHNLNLETKDCLAFEDSYNGLQAALAATLKTIVTPSIFTSEECFEGAIEILPSLESFDLSAYIGTSA